MHGHPPEWEVHDEERVIREAEQLEALDDAKWASYRRQLFAEWHAQVAPGCAYSESTYHSASVFRLQGFRRALAVTSNRALGGHRIWDFDGSDSDEDAIANCRRHGMHR
jgi:hypothetical protein